MPKVYVPISAITSDRKLKAGDDLDDLKKAMESRGMERPPLLTPEYKIIDGLRRIEVLRGWEHRGQILCVVTDEWEEILRYLEEETSIHGPYSLTRAAEVYLDAREYGRRASHAARGALQRGKKKGDGRQPRRMSHRQILRFIEAVGWDAAKPWLIENTIDFIRIGTLPLPPGPRAEWNRLQVEVDAGRITPGGARNRMRRRWSVPQLNGKVTAPAQTSTTSTRRITIQPEWVLHAIGTAEGAIVGLNQIGYLDEVIAKFEPDQIKDMIKRTEEFRRQTSSLLNTLRKAAQ